MYSVLGYSDKINRLDTRRTFREQGTKSINADIILEEKFN